MNHSRTPNRKSPHNNRGWSCFGEAHSQHPIENSWRILIATERALNDFVGHMARQYAFKAISVFDPFPMTKSEEYLMGQYKAQFEAAKTNHRDIVKRYFPQSRDQSLHL